MFHNPILEDLVTKYRENKLAHAYLIETNNETLIIEDLKKFISYINCPQEYHEECKECNLCNLINKNLLPSLKIIEPDGAGIKKIQIEELKDAFSKVPIYSKYNIYIIKSAEKLNASSANSMLKFLEEPTDGIIGFFISNNKDIIIDTIKSRCQSIIINYDNEDICLTLNISNEEYVGYCEHIKEYLTKIEDNKIINNKAEVLSYYPERKDVIIIFQIIFQIFYQNFLKIIGLEYNQNINQIYNINVSEKEMIKKLNIISATINNLSYNVNIEQALDKFVIEMRDSNE